MSPRGPRVLRRKKLVIPLTGYEWEQVRGAVPSAAPAALEAWARGLLLAHVGGTANDAAPDAAAPVAAGPIGEMAAQLADAERAAIEDAMRATDGNQTRAAERLGISRRCLIHKLERYGLKPAPVTRIAPRRTGRTRARR